MLTVKLLRAISIFMFFLSITSHTSADNKLNGGVHWRRPDNTAHPILLYYHNHATSNNDIYWLVNHSAEHYRNNNTNLKPSFASNSTYPHIDIIEGTYTGSSDNFIGQARTTYNASTMHISFVEIRLNRRYGWSFAQWDHVICQEWGHALGLGHRYTDTSCMNDTPSKLGNMRHAEWHDYDLLRTLHNH